MILVGAVGCGGQVLERSTSSSGGTPGSDGDPGASSGSSSGGVSAGSIGCALHSETVLTTDGSTMDLAADGSTLYFREDFNDRSRLYALRDDGSPATVLRETNGGQWLFLAGMSGSSLYYNTFGALYAMPKAGGDAAPMYTSDTLSACWRGTDAVYCYDNSLLVRAPLAGGAATTRQLDPFFVPLGVDDASFIYGLLGYPEGDAPRVIQKLPKAGGTPVTISNEEAGIGNGGALGAAQDDQNLYVQNTKARTLTKYPKAGGTPLVLARGDAADWIVSLLVDHGRVYWIHGATGPTRELMTVPTTGGAPQRLATVEGSAYALARVGDTFYYTTYFSVPGALKRLTCAQPR